MFLRYGQVVGQAGVIYALVIVVISKIITTLTSLSLSAIATNTEVKGGGAYFLISRSLGVEFGGAIGVVFFLAQAISVAMYVIGFSEAFADSYGEMFGSPTLIATVTTSSSLSAYSSEPVGRSKFSISFWRFCVRRWFRFSSARQAPSIPHCSSPI